MRGEARGGERGEARGEKKRKERTEKRGCIFLSLSLTLAPFPDRPLPARPLAPFPLMLEV